MVEVCGVCRKPHETGGDVSYFGMSIKWCPEVPENTFIPIDKIPVVIYGPQRERFESYRYQLEGLRHSR